LSLTRHSWEPDNKVGQKGVDPLSNLPFNQWWFHGYIDQAPPEGEFLELPAGGSFIGQVSCDKASTIYGPEGENTPVPPRACTVNRNEPDQSGALHSADPWSTPVDQVQDVKGTAIAIVYESDVHKIKPEDFVVISTNARSPWIRDTEYKIPAGLPPCPEGGCHCMWGWIHGTKGGKPNEMYMTGYRCNVTNADPNGRPLPKPRLANKCVEDKSNCTVGAKQAHFWAQAEGNNNFQDNGNDPPYYNADYGFMDGAQTDLWDTPAQKRRSRIL